MKISRLTRPYSRTQDGSHSTSSATTGQKQKARMLERHSLSRCAYSCWLPNPLGVMAARIVDTGCSFVFFFHAPFHFIGIHSSLSLFVVQQGLRPVLILLATRPMVCLGLQA